MPKNIKVSFDEKLEFSSKEFLAISHYKWVSNGYEPVVKVFLVYNEYAFKIKFLVNEVNPKHTTNVHNGKIHEDSCVEFFVIPYKFDKRYINFETNSLGFMKMSLGENRFNRTPLVFDYIERLNVVSNIFENNWEVEYQIDFDMLKEIYQTNSAPTNMKANFYKCGDKTMFAHYGMWNEINSLTPDFHLSEFFGDVILD